MVIAGIALFVSLGGTSIAAVSYVSNAGAVDGKSAVYAGSSLSQAAGKLVATNRSGTDKGRLPGKFVADVPKTQTFSRSFEVADNAPGAPSTVTAPKVFANEGRTPGQVAMSVGSQWSLYHLCTFCRRRIPTHRPRATLV
jgi:hypothetical protein